jgi:cytochrome b pre-mRNA-processing protein 3
MNKSYYNLYNNFIELSRNKVLYSHFKQQDVFSDRLIFFLIHFAFFLKIYKNQENTKKLQEIYDFFFRQLELNIREVGYGDQSINKKMKDYINLFHNIISEIHFWNDLTKLEKQNKFSSFVQNSSKIDHIIDYFEEFNEKLSKKNLISFLNSVSNK